MVILEKKVEGAAASELDRFVRKAQALTRVRGEVAVLITGNARVRELNRRFRRKDKPTDVLSFPRSDGGDIAISFDIASENAHRYGHYALDELKILVLHGMLHLAGYDHERDNGRMAAREAHLRAQLQLPPTLIERTAAAKDNMERSRPRLSHARNVDRSPRLRRAKRKPAARRRRP
jgi:probable rRNA maturation factor